MRPNLDEMLCSVRRGDGPPYRYTPPFAVLSTYRHSRDLRGEMTDFLDAAEAAVRAAQDQSTPRLVSILDSNGFEVAMVTADGTLDLTRARVEAQRR